MRHLIILLLTGCASIANSSTDIPTQVIKWVELNIVKVIVYTPDGSRASGTGFLITPNLVITSCHVVDGFAGTLVSQQGDKELHTVTVLKCDKDKDLALLSVDDTILRSYYAVIARYIPSFATQTFSAGYHSGLPLMIVEGHWQRLSTITKEYLYLDTNHTLPGDSGSPVLIWESEAVQVVGVRTAVLTDGAGHLYPYTAFVTPINILREFLNEIK